MRQYVTFLLLGMSVCIMSAQNVGINTIDPKVSLDISGALAHRSMVVLPFQNNVNVPVNITFLVIGIEGISGNINIVDPEEWVDGRRLVIYNSTGYSATFSGEMLMPNETKEFICKAPSGGWRLLSGSGVSMTNSWATDGNTGINAATQFLGTNDENDLVIKTNGKERIRLDDTTTTLKFSTDLLDTNSIILSNIDPTGSLDFKMSSYLNPFPTLNFSLKGTDQASYVDQKDILNLGWDGSVGIGTHIGNGKLTVNHRTFGQSLPSISIIDSSLNNTSGGILQFSNIFGTPTLSMHGLIGNNPTGADSYFLYSCQGNYLMRLRGDGNLGLGLNDPTSKLDVNGDISIRGNNRLEFGKGIVDKEANAGTIWYQKYSSGLDIVGAGSNSDLSDRKVSIWAAGGTNIEGKLDVYGDINTTGKVKINGNAGTSGQVLTSNGPSADPSWQAAPVSAMLPIAFGSVNGNTGAIYTGSGNFTVTKYALTPGRYGVEIIGDDYSPNTHIVNVTITDVTGHCLTQIAENTVVSPLGFMVSTDIILVPSSGGTTDILPYDADFSFVVYKP